MKYLINHENQSQHAAMDAAIKSGSLDLVRQIRRLGGRPSLVYLWPGRLLEAAKTGDTKQVELLLAAGVSPLETDEQGNTPLMAACFGGHFEAAQAILEVYAEAAKEAAAKEED